MPLAHAQHHPNPSHTSTRMAAAGSTPVEVLPQDDEPLLCHRSDGVLLTENNTGVIDLFNAVCCPVFLNTHTLSNSSLTTALLPYPIATHSTTASCTQSFMTMKPTNVCFTHHNTTTGQLQNKLFTFPNSDGSDLAGCGGLHAERERTCRGV